MSKSSDAAELIRVFIIDPQPVLCAGLSSICRFPQNGKETITVVGSASNFDTAVPMIAATNADVVFFDPLDGSDGLAIIEKIPCLKTAYIAWTDLKPLPWLASRILMMRVSHKGRGYISKKDCPDAVLAAIKKVAEGEVACPQSLLTAVLSQSNDPSGVIDPLKLLSERETEVLVFIGHGMSTKQIAAKMHISHKTVETHREKMKTKLNVLSSSELVYAAITVALSGHLPVAE